MQREGITSNSKGIKVHEAFELFMLDMQARRLKPVTQEFYQIKLKGFFNYCNSQQIIFATLPARYPKSNKCISQLLRQKLIVSAFGLQDRLVIFVKLSGS